ncbi:BamA/TamA family outer membrane protein [bacterium]|nr:BamA/TamA family outer membrane protein [bacterium]
MRLIPALLLIPGCIFAETIILDRIAVFGNHVTHTGVILRELELQPGRPVTDSIMISDRSWLIRSDFLKKIDFQLKPSIQKDICALLLVVQEKGHWSFMPSFHTDDLFGMTGGGTLKYRNLSGRRQQLRLNTETGGKTRIGLTWSDPWFGGSWRLFSQATVYYLKMPYPYPDYPDEFTETIRGGELLLGRQPGRTVQIGLRLCREELRSTDRAVLVSDSRSDLRTGTGLFMKIDTRDWPAYPGSGLFVHTGLDHFHFKGGHTEQGIMNIRAFFPVRSSNILAVQIFARALAGTVPVYDRLHLGGGDMVRGIPTGTLAGNRLVMANMEYRFPIMYERHFEENLHVGYAGVLFLDIGSAWFSESGWDTRDLRCAVGVGVHALWDDYVIRGEYGTRGKGWGFIKIGTNAHF